MYKEPELFSPTFLSVSGVRRDFAAVRGGVHFRFLFGDAAGTAAQHHQGGQREQRRMRCELPRCLSNCHLLLLC